MHKIVNVTNNTNLKCMRALCHCRNSTPHTQFSLIMMQLYILFCLPHVRLSRNGYELFQFLPLLCVRVCCKCISLYYFCSCVVFVVGNSATTAFLFLLFTRNRISHKRTAHSTHTRHIYIYDIRFCMSGPQTTPKFPFILV